MREPIPLVRWALVRWALVRWALAPLRTFLLWRRMALWQITSYRVAVDTEPRLRRATALLRTSYGRRWRRHAPADLVWMLRTGVAVAEACERVCALVEVANTATTAYGTSSRNATDALQAYRSSHSGARQRRTSAPPAPGHRDDTAVWSEVADAYRDRFGS